MKNFGLLQSGEEITLGGTGIMDYLGKTVTAVRPMWIFLVSVINYVLFPDEAYVPAFIALMVAVVLDIITKYYSISVQRGGLKKAISTKAISSASLWQGTWRKLVSYFVVMILAGLSVRVTMLISVAVFLSTVAYSIMFLREAQSCIENLMDAGHEDVEWLLFYLKRKQKDVLKNEGVVNPVEAGVKATTPGIVKEGTDYEKRV